MHALNVAIGLREETVQSDIDADLVYERFLIAKYAKPCGCPKGNECADCDYVGCRCTCHIEI